MFASFIEFGQRAPLLSEADRSTLAIARHQLLLCASDDGLVIRICQECGIAYTRTLRLLTEMLQTVYKTVAEAIALADGLIQERDKWIAPVVLEGWHRELRKYGSG